MLPIKKFLSVLTEKERFLLFFTALVFVVTGISFSAMTIGEKSVFVPVEGGNYREGVIGQPVFLNPIISNNQVDQDLSALIYSRLMDIVSDYEPSKDYRVYTLKIKEDLVWDDGEPLTSDDIIYTIKTIQKMENHSPIAKSWQGVMAERESEIKVKFILPTPYTFFKESLGRLPVIPKHIFDRIPSDNIKLSAYSLKPVGSGPYKFSDFKTRKDGFITEYHLVPNEKYHGDKPFIRDFYFNFYPDEKSLVSAFELRQINGFGTSLGLSDRTRESSNTKIEKIAMPRYYAIFFNPIVSSLFKDANFRLALQKAAPMEKIMAEMSRNDGQPVTSPIIRSAIGLPPENGASQYDPDGARLLLQRVKLPEDASRIVVNLIVPQVDFLERTAEILKSAWLDIGVSEVNIISLNPDDLVNEVIKTRNYEMILFGNVFENPLDLFSFWHSSQRFYPGLNLAMYQNLEVDRAIEAIRQTDDIEKVRPLLERLEKLITDDLPAIFLYSLPYHYVHTDRLDGIDLSSLVVPADRFRDVSAWNVQKVRVLK